VSMETTQTEQSAAHKAKADLIQKKADILAAQLRVMQLYGGEIVNNMGESTREAFTEGCVLIADELVELLDSVFGTRDYSIMGPA
jgi:hypothetical protein